MKTRMCSRENGLKSQNPSNLEEEKSQGEKSADKDKKFSLEIVNGKYTINVLKKIVEVIRSEMNSQEYKEIINATNDYRKRTNA